MGRFRIEELSAPILTLQAFPMGRICTILFAALVMILGVVPAHGADPAANSSKAIMAYYESGGSYQALVHYGPALNEIATDTFGVDDQGNISGNTPKAALKIAHSRRMLSFATVSNFGTSDFSPHIAHLVLTAPRVRARAIASMLRLVKDSGYSGVNIDFESIPRQDRDAFSSFVRAVSRRMHAAGYLNVVSIPAELKDNPYDSWTGAFDFKALGEAVDIFQLMTYDENGPWGPAGPVAALNWVEACVRFTVTVVPPGKISLGIPAYGYDWNLKDGTGRQIHWKDIPALIASTGATPQWDAVASSPFFSYQGEKGANHVVWYEDATSIPLKSALAVSYNLAGVSVFALGFEDQSFWDAVHAGGF
jgi:spore germination protein